MIDVSLVGILVVPLVFVLGLSLGRRRARIWLLRDSHYGESGYGSQYYQPQ